MITCFQTRIWPIRLVPYKALRVDFSRKPGGGGGCKTRNEEKCDKDSRVCVGSFGDE